MKICHVITRMIVGGAQENTLFTVRGHLEHGHDTVLVTGPSQGPEGALLDTITVPGLETVMTRSLVRELDPISDIRAYRWLRQFFVNGQFDIVHTHSSKAGIVGRVAARHAGIPVVVHTVHGSPFHHYQSRWRNHLYIAAEKAAARYCDRIYAVADAMVNQYLSAGIGTATQYQTVYSGMELDAFVTAKADPELRHTLGIPADAPVIGKIARLFELKGYEFLLDAAPTIVEAVPNAHFLIVGDGILRDSLEQHVNKLGLRDRFVFAGLVPPDQIPRYTALMDVLVHLSLREGLPRTVVQALATGKPAIGFDLDGTPEVIIDGKTGWLIPPKNAVAVAEAAIAALHDPQHTRALGESGREHVRHRWHWRTMVDTLEADYDRLLAKLK